MSQIPKESEAIVDPRTGRMSRSWRRYLIDIGTGAATTDGQPSSPNLSDIAALTTNGYLVKTPTGVYTRSMQEGEGITIANPSASTNPTIFSLALYDDTGAGDGLWKFTRDEFGRVEGTQEATAEDLAYNDSLLAMGVSDVQAALDLTLGAIAFPSDTAPDPTEHSRWLDTTTMTEYLWYDDGTSAQWVDVGGGSLSADAADVIYDNSVSGLTATDVQAAIDEIAALGGGGGGISDGDKGDITVSSSGTVWNIDAGVVGTTELANDAVTYAKLQDVSATARILGRKTASAGDAEECTLSEVLDFVGSAAQGDILYRGASAWARLGAGTSGQLLKTNGAGANPSWVTPSAGGISSGTSNPGSPSTNDLFFRTDLGLMIYYDGTRWLTVNEYESGSNGNGTGTTGTTVVGITTRIPVRQDFGIYLTKWVNSTFVQTTNTGAAYWTVALDRYTAGNTAANVTSFTTGTTPDTPTNWTNHDVTINAVLNSTAREMVITLSKTGAPGTFFSTSALYYRLIIT